LIDACVLLAGGEDCADRRQRDRYAAQSRDGASFEILSNAQMVCGNCDAHCFFLSTSLFGLG
jgi:hypothetical protein